MVDARRRGHRVPHPAGVHRDRGARGVHPHQPVRDRRHDAQRPRARDRQRADRGVPPGARVAPEQSSCPTCGAWSPRWARPSDVSFEDEIATGIDRDRGAPRRAVGAHPRPRARARETSTTPRSSRSIPDRRGGSTIGGRSGRDLGLVEPFVGADRRRRARGCAGRGHCAARPTRTPTSTTPPTKTPRRPASDAITPSGERAERGGEVEAHARRADHAGALVLRDTDEGERHRAGVEEGDADRRARPRRRRGRATLSHAAMTPSPAAMPRSRR